MKRLMLLMLAVSFISPLFADEAMRPTVAPPEVTPAEAVTAAIANPVKATPAVKKARKAKKVKAAKEARKLKALAAASAAPDAPVTTPASK